MEISGTKVCVTGGAGYIASLLVNKLLQKGHTVHATLRNLEDESKLSLLRSFPNADMRLILFKADIYKPYEFEHPIRGCEFVFHIATPLDHTQGSQYKNMAEATIAAAKAIATYCVRSGTVRRLIYTSSVNAASPIRHDGTGYYDFIDETCWTPLYHSFPFSNHFLKAYTDSKTLAEKEILSFDKNTNAGSGLEVVTIVSGLVCGGALLSFTPKSAIITLSQFTERTIEYNSLRFLEEVAGKLPLVHIQDICEAHIFCMEHPSISGRFLCASSYISSDELASYYLRHFPHELQLKQLGLDGPKRDNIRWNSTKLTEKGFKYKYDAKMILDDCLKCARRMGDI